MSATPYYELPIFGAHDPVDLLVTYNAAMGTVDSQLKANELAATAAANAAATAQNMVEECADAVEMLAQRVFSPDYDHDDDVDVDMLANLKVDTHGIVYYIPIM